MEIESVPRGMTPSDDRPRTAQSFRSQMQSYDANSASDQGPGPATVETTPPPRTAVRSRLRLTPRETDNVGQNRERERDSRGPISDEQTIELFRRKLQEARKETEHVLSGPDDVVGAMKPTLTIDLGRARIARLPDAVIDMIIADVERLSLSHNQLRYLPERIDQCTQLRYLNIRSNEFTEIPPQVFRMPFLEILDISKNRIQRIPPQIKKLEALRVFSIQHNKLRDLPCELAELPRLRMLKVANNYALRRINEVMRRKEQDISFSTMTDNEKDAALSAEVLQYLKNEKLAVAETPTQDQLEGSEPPSAIEPMRPSRRAASGAIGRFPVRTIPSEPPTENSDSVNQMTKPNLPQKSHLRGMSSQSNSGFVSRRPGITPMPSSNDRNRSNSDNLLSSSAAAQQKRSMLRRDRSELDSIDEGRLIRQSHYRGLSYGSHLKRNGSISSPGAASSSPSSPRDTRKDRPQQYVRRLSSLPEHKSDNVRRPLIEGAKGILYALYQVHPHIHGLIGASKAPGPHRSGLEMTFHSVGFDVDKLNKSLEDADNIGPEDEDAWERQEEIINLNVAACIKKFEHVTTQLQDSTRRIIANADPRYVRTLMLLLYGSIVEIKNAIKSFGIEVKHHRQMSSGTTHRIDTIPEEPTSQSPVPPHSLEYEIDERTLKQPSRLRSDTVLKLPPSDPSFQPVQPPALQIPENMNFTTAGINGPYSRSTSALSHNSNRSFTARSRSNSRSVNAIVAVDGQSTVSSTPRSNDSYQLPPMASASSRPNPNTGLTEAQEEQRFEQIFMALTKASETALKAIPITIDQFRRFAATAQDQNQPKTVIDLWAGLVQKSQHCHELSQGLQHRLVSMKMKDSGVGLSNVEGGRHDPSFWVLCKSFMSSFVGLLTEMKEARKSRMLIIPQEAIGVLRPVQKACQEAGHAIATSPWNHLLENVNPMPAPTPFPSAGQQPPTRPHFNRSATVANSNVSSYSAALTQVQSGPAQYAHYPPNSRLQTNPPIASMSSLPTSSLPTPTSATGISPMSANSPIPATPLSAALGAAAQATVPSTPASLYGDSFFKGDVFQRADSVLSMPQAFMNRR